MAIRQLTPNEQRTWRTFLHASTRLLTQLDDELKKAHNERMSDFDVLSNLSEAPGRVLRMSELAEQTLFSRSRLTYTVNNLERRGLVTRKPDQRDGRGIVAALTAKGRSLHRKLAVTHVAGIRRHFLDQMGIDEQADLTKALSGIRDQLETTDT